MDNTIITYVTPFETIELRGEMAKRLVELRYLASGDKRRKPVKQAIEKVNQCEYAIGQLSEFCYREGYEIKDLL